MPIVYIVLNFADCANSSANSANSDSNFSISRMHIAFSCPCLFLIIIEVQLICKFALVSSMQQSESVIHISTVFLDSFPI